MTDRELLYIKTIAEEKNITKAAGKLHVAQPSLTQYVQRIEKSLDGPLFYRTKRGLFLTDIGRLYYDAACRILDIWGRLEQDVESVKHLDGGTLTIGASWYNTLVILNQVVPVYCRRHPGVKVKLLEGNSGELEKRLQEGEADLIFRHQYPEKYPYRKENGKNLRVVSLLKENFCVAAHEKFSVAKEEEPQTADPVKMAELPFIRFSENQRIRHITDFVMEMAGIAPASVLTVYGFPNALELAAQGVGAVVLPELYANMCRQDHRQLRFYRIAPELSPYWISQVCYYQAEYLPVTVERFLEVLNETKEEWRHGLI